MASPFTRIHSPKSFRNASSRASKLYAMLTAGHHDLHLPADDLRRITLWLDCCSMFYGVYEAETGRAQLQGEVARPTLE